MTEKTTDTATPRRPVVVGVRATKQRSAISDLLDTIEEFKSAQDLHDELRKRGHPGARPGVERSAPGGPTMTITDPCGNVLRFCQRTD